MRISFSSYKNKNLNEKATHNIDGREYYVYRLYDKEDNEHYYGSRIRVKSTIEDDFWFYCTSSKKKEVIKKNKKRFKLKIIKTFNNADDMYYYESFLHFTFDVKNNPLFWNKSNQTPFGFTTAGTKQNHSKEHIEKRTKGRNKSMESKDSSGLSKYKLAGIKGKETRSKIQENGLSGAQNLAIKAWETKKANGFKFTSANNPRLNTIIILDSDEEIFDIIETGFVKYCKEKSYPMNALRKSYTTNNDRLYEKLDAGNLARLINTIEYKKFKGFSAYKMQDLPMILKDKLKAIMGEA